MNTATSTCRLYSRAAATHWPNRSLATSASFLQCMDHLQLARQKSLAVRKEKSLAKKHEASLVQIPKAQRADILHIPKLQRANPLVIQRAND